MRSSYIPHLYSCILTIFVKSTYIISHKYRFVNTYLKNFLRKFIIFPIF